MSENLNRDFSKYETMSTEELEKLLRLDAEAPAGAEEDTELVLFILEVLARRKKAENITGNNAQKAWESFQENYMPEEAKKPAVWTRKLAAAAAVVVLLILIPVSTSALSLGEVWDIFARWARETFSFVSGENTNISEPSPDDEKEYASLQELLQLEKRDPSIVPTWIPEEFTLMVIEKDSTPMQENYSAIYLDSLDKDKKLCIQVRTHLSSDIQNNEILNDPIEIYPSEGINYYIFKNNTQLFITWMVETYECFISGDVSIDEAKLMIDSIRKG